MQSRNKNTDTTETTPTLRHNHLVFFPLLTLILILWFLYRSLFAFPVWFDETVGKALFFGIPVWVYIAVTGFGSITDSFASYKLREGLLLGIAVGGMYGFLMSILSLAQRGAVVEAVLLFDSPVFWKEFVLALLTSYWETLLFFGFVMTVLMDKYRKWSFVKLSLVTAIIFVIFHIPNALLRFSGVYVLSQIFVLSLFAFGQALLFYERRNGYALVLSQAIWGMVLLVHAW